MVMKFVRTVIIMMIVLTAGTKEDIIMDKLEELKMYVHQLIEMSSLEDSVVLQPVLNKIYELEME